MDKNQILNKINDLLKEIFDDNSINVDEFTVANDIDGWDSLMHIAVISTIENEFNADFSMNEVVGFKNIGDIVRLIYEKTNL